MFCSSSRGVDLRVLSCDSGSVRSRSGLAPCRAPHAGCQYFHRHFMMLCVAPYCEENDDIQMRHCHIPSSFIGRAPGQGSATTVKRWHYRLWWWQQCMPTMHIAPLVFPWGAPLAHPQPTLSEPIPSPLGWPASASASASASILSHGLL